MLTVLITGGGSGLGAATARLLAAQGHRVHVAGRTAATVEGVAAAIVADGGRARAHVLDVRDRDACERVVDAVVAEHGRLDVLVNNAGLFRRGTATEVSGADWAESIEVNLTGALHAAQAAVRRMRGQPAVDGCRGQVLNVNSGAGLHAYPASAGYTASKFGLLGLSDALRQEVATDLIKVTDVVVATAVESNLSGRQGVRRLPATTVARVVADVVAMPGPAVLTRVDLSQLPAADPH